MSEENLKHWVINEQELAAVQDFIGSLALPWKQTNPYMLLLGNLKPVNYQLPSEPATKLNSTPAKKKAVTK